MATIQEIRDHLRKTHPELAVGTRGRLSASALSIAAHEGLTPDPK